jgi:hypothetical protein
VAKDGYLGYLTEQAHDDYIAARNAVIEHIVGDTRDPEKGLKLANTSSAAHAAFLRARAAYLSSEE